VDYARFVVVRVTYCPTLGGVKVIARKILKDGMLGKSDHTLYDISEYHGLGSWKIVGQWEGPLP
jgi:hypothetical protein